MTLSQQSKEAERVKTKNLGEMEKESQRDRKNQKLEEMGRKKE